MVHTGHFLKKNFIIFFNILMKIERPEMVSLHIIARLNLTCYFEDIVNFCRLKFAHAPSDFFFPPRILTLT